MSPDSESNMGIIRILAPMIFVAVVIFYPECYEIQDAFLAAVPGGGDGLSRFLWGLAFFLGPMYALDAFFLGMAHVFKGLSSDSPN